MAHRKQPVKVAGKESGRSALALRATAMETPRTASFRTSLFLVLGATCFALGAIGAFLPLLPTTPFMILAAYCFSKGSHRAHSWLLKNRWFGPTLRQWEEDRSIDPMTRRKALLAMAIALTIAGTWFATVAYQRGILAVTGLLVAVYLLRLPTRRRQ